MATRLCTELHPDGDTPSTSDEGCKEYGRAGTYEGAAAWLEDEGVVDSSDDFMACLAVTLNMQSSSMLRMMPKVVVEWFSVASGYCRALMLCNAIHSVWCICAHALDMLADGQQIVVTRPAKPQPNVVHGICIV